jgi:hypothetical protein
MTPGTTTSSRSVRARRHRSLGLRLVLQVAAAAPAAERRLARMEERRVAVAATARTANRRCRFIITLSGVLFLPRL